MMENSWETLQALLHPTPTSSSTPQKPALSSPRLQELRRHPTQEGQRVKQRLKSQRVEDLLETLSRREWEVLMGLLRGQSCKQIGAALHIGLPTITKHRGHLLEKLHVTSVTDLITLLWSNVATEHAHAN